jgi:hypothetical protein
MARQMLIYEGVVPVSQKRHGDWSVKTGVDYGFARDVNSMPLMAVEFPFAAAEYPIVFAGTKDEVLPAVILGARDGENVFYKEDTGWQAKYIPAFVRRYPFVFSVSDDGKQFTLCIDEKFSGCNQEGRGERLFDSEGERSQYLAGILNFLKDYQAHFQRTQLFCKKLKELDLLEEMRAQFTLPTGQNLALQGFMAINRERLKKLSGEQLADLVKTDELEMMYLHMQSMRNFRAMMERVTPGQTTPEEAGAPAAEPKPAEDKKASAKKSGKK